MMPGLQTPDCQQNNSIIAADINNLSAIYASQRRILVCRNLETYLAPRVRNYRARCYNISFYGMAIALMKK